MNLKYYLLVAVAALSLSACSTDDTSTEPENGGYKISFTVAEDLGTRTTLTSGDFLRWVPTDKVGVYTVGKNRNINTLTVADVNQSPVEFIGVLEKLVSPGDMFYAYYPYDAEQSTDPSAVKLTIPAEQTQTKAGVYNGQSQPLVALPMAFPWERDSYACRISSVRFRQLGAIVELQLYSSDEALRSEKIRSVTFESDTPLAGNFSFNLTTVKDKVELPISGYELKEATTSLEEPAAIPATGDEAALVYLTIAPGKYTGQIVVKTNAAQYTVRLAEAMTFERAVIKGLRANLAEAKREIIPDSFIHFEDSEVKRICVENWDTNSDGELSYKEAAAVTSIEAKFIGKSISSFNELQYFTGLKTIGNRAFERSSRLTSIVIPDGVTEIGNTAFFGCSSLTSVNIPEGVTTIGLGAFMSCRSLTSINIPQTVTYIVDEAFAGCTSLSAFYGKYASADHRCLIQDGILHAFAPADLIEYTIPDGVTKIGTAAFSGCSSLTNIHIPDGVTTFRLWAFSGCSSLTSIYIPQTVSSIDNAVFKGCTSLSAFYGKYASADHRCLIQDGTLRAFAPADLTEYTIPDGVTAIGGYAFSECTSLTSIHLPDGVTTIGEGAFKSCRSLPSIHIPNGVTEIGEDAFWYCTSLTSIHIPDGVTTIGSRAFMDCSSLTSITIPDGVTTIGNWVFNDCSSLTSVYCKPTTPPTLGTDVFSDTPSSMQIYVPAASVDAYKTAESWSGYASQIVADNN